MPVKYIRPNNLITDRKTTKLVKQKKFISENEYEMKVSVIQELLKELNLENFQIDENIKNDYENFSKIRDEVSDKIEDIINYIDELKNNEDYDIEQIKAIVKEKIEKEIYERYKIYSNTNNNCIRKNLIVENMNKHISNVEYNDEKINNEKYKRINTFLKNLVNDTIYKIKNIKDGDLIILYDENEYNIENINEFCIEDKYNKINTSNKNIEKYNFNGKLVEDCNLNNTIKYINNTNGIKTVSIKKQCTKMSFYYKTYSRSNNSIYLYIDGVYKGRYKDTSLTQAVINDLTDEEHEFTWVLYNYSESYYSYIDTIAFNGTVETDSSKFSNNCNIPLADIPIESNYKNGDISSTPFYNNTTGVKIVSIKKQCTSMSFYYKTYSRSNNSIYLYIDGIYKDIYTSTSWKQAIIDNLTDEEHEFTWVLYNYNSGYYSSIDTIAFNSTVETDSSKFSNTYEKELEDEYYKNGTNSSTPFYNDTIGVKIVSIKKQCTKMSFYYKVGNSNYRYIFLYIDGIYKGRYASTSWTQVTINDLTNEEHEFTWVLYSGGSSYYSCIDTIAFNDIIETDSSKFSNTYEKELKGGYINESLSTTPFYNNTTGVKIVSIKKQCTKMSFYYRIYESGADNYVFLYIDGIYKNEYYTNDSWIQVTINDLTDEEHEFTWVLYNEGNYYSCIDTIAFEGTVETDSSKFSNSGNIPLADIPTESNYKNGDISSTPFYNNTTGVKIVSIKKQCTKMSFYYRVNSTDSFYNCIYLYIDGIYKGRYNNTNTLWSRNIIDNLTDEEHEFTWVLYSYSSSNYSCIDTIAFDGTVETDSSKFSNTYEKELEYSNDKYNNGVNSSTPFYNDTNGVKIVSIKKQCTKMSFYYRVSTNSYSELYLYIDGIYKNEYYGGSSWKQAIIDDITDEEHEFTWVLYSRNGNYSGECSCIDTIAFDDIVETDSSKFSNTYEKELKYFKNTTNSSTPFYNNANGVKIVSIKKQCTKMSFYYKTYNNDNSEYSSIYLYIDGIYKNRYASTSWTQVTINDLIDEEHEFTWVLYSSSSYYSCIDTIAFEDTVETDSSKFSNTYEKELKGGYINESLSTTPFYNDTIGVKIVSIKKQCTKMSFYYKVGNSNYRYIFLYIDGIYKGRYASTSWTQVTINDLTNEEHEFTWVLFNYSSSYYSCIDTIAFDDIIETDSSKFSNNANIPLAKNIDVYMNEIKSTTPFYNNANGVKIVSIKKQCTKMSFYYKTYNDNDYYSSIFLYIDGIYKGYYNSDTTWTQGVINNLTDKEHEFTWVLYSGSIISYYSCIDTIAFNDIVETDSSKFSNNCSIPLANIPTNSTYINSANSSTPFYKNANGVKIVSIKKQCTKMSFYYKTYNNDNSEYSSIYLYIDGIYKNRYASTSWKQAIIDNLTDEEHEFTWVLYKSGSGYYSCIDTIAFNDIIETDSNKFNNTYEKELKGGYINESLSTTPFYNDTNGIKIVSIKKQCTKMSFCYKINTGNKNDFNNYIYLYIDGVYKNRYHKTNTSWRQITINGLTDEEHEFTWVLYSSNNYYLCIDTIAFDDTIETDSSKFSNTYEKELECINNKYINGANSSTPFYNDTIGVKIVSIKKQCTKMSFCYKVLFGNDDYNSIFLYIDGIYKNRYVSTSWSQVTINDLTDEEHEFTWVLYSGSSYYSCIDTIAFNNIIETDSSKFSNNGNILLADIPTDSNYKNGDISSTPFYNNTTGVKIVSIKKQCTSMSFYYKVLFGNDDNSIYLYIDGIYKGIYYTNTSWSQVTINDLTDEEHEFTWVLYSSDSNRHSCIDTIAFDGTVETDSSKFSNTYEKELEDGYYKNGTNSSTPFYNNTNGVKIVSIKKQCTKMSFYYRVSYDIYDNGNGNQRNYRSVFLYIDGIYKGRCYNTSWTQVAINDLTDEEHEFTWVLYSSGRNTYHSCIDTIAFNDIVETDSSKFSNTYEKELEDKYYKNGSESSTPFYNDVPGVKIVSIKKQCTSMSFYYRVNSNSIFLYIDGIYKNRYVSTSWTQVTINDLTNEEHEFTWVLYKSDNYYSCIDTIAFDDIIETDSNKFNNTYEKELEDGYYKNGSESSTPFYNNAYRFKIVSIKKQCTSMSFYYRMGASNDDYNSIYLYIDGIYKGRYASTSWRQAIIDNLTDEEHEFTWVLYSRYSDCYSCIDTIAFDGTVETDSSKFSNNCNIQLSYLYNLYENGINSSTPFYNNAIGFKIVSIKKRCTEMSFYYKVYSVYNNYSFIYLYIDGIYKGIYATNSWTQVTINDLTDEEHEFTWVLYNYTSGSIISYYSCIDTIAFDGTVETDSSKFSNSGNVLLADIPTDSNYKNDSDSSTPFYNNTTGVKIVSIKKQCTSMSFYYKVNSVGSNYDSVILYIDGMYKNSYYDTSWIQVTINNLTDEEHEFTWVLYSSDTNHYSCIDTIAFDGVVFNYEIEDTDNIDNLNINMINNKKLTNEILYNKLYNIKINNFKIYKKYKCENNTIFYIITDKDIYIIDNFYYFYYIIKNNNIKWFKILIYNENITDEKEYFKINEYDSENRKSELLIDEKDSNKILEIIDNSKEIEVYKKIE